MLHDARLRAPMLKFRRRRVARRPAGFGGLEHHEARGIGEGRVFQQDGVDHREDRRVGADANGKCEDGGRRKCRRSGQRAKGVLQVLLHVRQYYQAVCHQPPDD